MKERAGIFVTKPRALLVPVPHDVLYSQLRDGLSSGRIDAIKKIEESSETTFIRSKILTIGVFGYFDVNILPQNGWSRIKYNINYKKYYSMSIAIVSFTAIIMALLSISKIINPWVGAILTHLIAIPVLIQLLYVSNLENKTLEQFDRLLQDIELEYKNEIERKTTESKGLANEGKDLKKE